jgi:branched-chain amino acid transport system substrate-binding protein
VTLDQLEGVDQMKRMHMTVVVALAAAIVVSAAAMAAGAATKATPKPATGTPFVIGFVNTEGVPGLSFQNLRYGVEAAVKWVNRERGGIGGRPLALKTCILNATAAGSAGCANELAQAKVPLVVNGVDVASAALPILESAKIPYTSVVPVNPPEYTSPVASNFFAGSAGTYPATAYYIATVQKAKRVAIAFQDTPAGNFAADNVAIPALKQFGVTDTPKVGIPSAAADFTGFMAAIAKNDPNAVMVLGSANFCLRLAQARQSLGSKIPMYYSSGCFEEDTLKAGGAAFGGGFFPTSVLPYTDPSIPQVKLYLDKFKKYGEKGASPSGYTEMGFSTIVTLANMLNTMKPAARNAAGIQAKFKSLRNFPVFLAHPATCDGQQVAGRPGICNAWMKMVQIYNGKPVTLLKGKWISPTQIK